MNGVCASTGGSVVALKEVPHEEVGRYGVIAPTGPVDADGVVPIGDLVEKPPVDEAPSDLIIIGRYVLTPGRVRRDRRRSASVRSARSSSPTPCVPRRSDRRSTASSATSTASTRARRSASSPLPSSSACATRATGEDLRTFLDDLLAG